MLIPGCLSIVVYGLDFFQPITYNINMQKILYRDVWMRLVLAGGLVVLLGLHPLPHILVREFHNAHLEMKSGYPALASDALMKAVKYQYWRVDLRLEAARLAFQGGDFNTAIAIFSALKQEISLTSQDWLMLGEAYLKIGKVAQTEESWQYALEAGYDAYEINSRLLEIYQDQKDPEKMIQALKNLVQLRPNQPQLYYRLGLYLSAQSPQDALVYLEQAAYLDSSLDEPTQKLRQNIRLSLPQDEPAYSLVQTGRALAAMGEWKLASQAFSRATSLRPDYAEGWAFYAEALQHLDGVGSAEAYGMLEQALRADSSSTAAYALMSLYWSRQGEVVQALTALQQAVELKPDSAVLHTELGRLYALQGDFTKAQSAYERAVQLAPSDWSYRRALVGFLLQYHLDIRQMALPITRQLVLDAPKDPATLDLMGQVLFSLKDHLGAMRFFDRAHNLDPAYIPALLHMGSIYLYLGDETQAQFYLQRAAELAPQSNFQEQAERLIGFYFP